MPYSNRSSRRNRPAIILSVLFVSLSLLLAVVFRPRFPSDVSEAGSAVSSGFPAPAPEEQTDQSPEPGKTPSTEDEPVFSEEPAVAADPFDYSQPVPEHPSVGDEWFDDAIFIGDSRTEGLAIYSGLKNCRAYTRKGIMVDTLFTENVYDLNGTKVPIMDAVAAAPPFKKVYIMMGMNELGWPYVDQFAEDYALVIDRLHEIAPDAQIYVQSILPVTKEQSDGDQIYNNEKIALFNDAVRNMAAEKQVFYLDVADGISDESGCLPSDQAPDGIHLRTAGCQAWLTYLKTHTVEVDS